ncbi:MAG: hypothetical protein H3C58_02785 [Fimbriimonadaceae bacterium]|nr:hypothetical protein [Fimbriimonadaceae bacterium]
MLITEDEIRKAVSRAFEGAETQLKREPPHRIWGYIIWGGFENLAPEERYREVDAKVRTPLGLRVANLGVLIPLTQKEARKGLVG